MRHRLCAALLLIALVSGQRTTSRRRFASRDPASQASPSRGSSLSRGSSPPAAPSRATAGAASAGRRGSSSRVVPARTTPAPQAPTFDTECPQKDGFFADAFQCDRFYECRDFVITERMCPDGLVFNDYSVAFGRCDQTFGVNCTGREELQEPKPTGDCPRQNGYFADPEPARCGSFIHCVDGTSNRVTCPAGLVFSLQTGTCQWPDQAGRTGCSSEEVLEFKCPGTVDGKLSNPAPGFPLHPRYADPTDCQFFFSCLDGVVPRRHGCEAGRVFNDETKQCDKPKNVPECYYE